MDAQTRRDKAEAVDRALNRFSRFNELLLQYPSLHDVFYRHLDEISKDRTMFSYLWFVLNQMEGVYMDFSLGQLSAESFGCYDRWFKFRVGKKSAMREFLLHEEYKKYFMKPFRRYFEQIIALDSEPPE